MDTNNFGSEKFGQSQEPADNLKRTSPLDNDPDYDPATTIGATVNEGMSAPLTTRLESRVDDGTLGDAGTALHSRGSDPSMGTRGFQDQNQSGSERPESRSLSRDGSPLADHLPLAQIKQLEEILIQVRENLFGPQQQELVRLLDDSFQLVSRELGGITQNAKATAASLQSNLKSDPYTGIVTAMRVGFALRQIYMNRRSHTLPPVDASVPSAMDRADLH